MTPGFTKEMKRTRDLGPRSKIQSHSMTQFLLFPVCNCRWPASGVTRPLPMEIWARYDEVRCVASKSANEA